MLFLLACVPVQVGGVSPDIGLGGDDSGGTSDTASLPGEPAWTLIEVEQALQSLLIGQRPSAAPVFRAYGAMMTHRSGNCPRLDQDDREEWSTWFGGQDPVNHPEVESCTTPDGWGFYGLSIAGRACVTREDGPFTVELGLLASYLVTSPEGLVTEGGGSNVQTCTWEGESGTCTSQITGEFRFGGQPGWVGDGIDASVITEGAWSGDDWTLTVDGGAGFEMEDVFFEALVLTPAGVSGKLALRDPTGFWHEIGIGADGCGDVTWRGAPSGRICPDFSAWLTPPDTLADLCEGAWEEEEEDEHDDVLQLRHDATAALPVVAPGARQAPRSACSSVEISP